MSQAVFATGAGAEVVADAEGDGVTQAVEVGLADAVTVGAAVAVAVVVGVALADVVGVTDVLGVADVLGADVPDGLAVGLAAGALGVGVTVADAVGNGRWCRRPGAMAAAGDTAAGVDVAGVADALADPLSEGVAQAAARLTAFPADFNEVPECAVISIPPTTPRTATTIPIITPMWVLGCSSRLRYWRATLRR
jgi:hypothetical protein